MSEAKLSPRLKSTGAGVAEPEPSGRTRILLVEGDGFTRLVLLLRLRLAGFGVDFTSNGIIGLGKLRSCQPDVLLVELKLCGLSGLELIKAARAEPSFGNRPIYVFTDAERMNRTTRKEVGLLGTKVFDKSAITREQLVKTFVTTFISDESTEDQPGASTGAESVDETLSEMVPPGAIEQIIAGVREQSKLLAQDTGARVASGSELLSRVCSLASCAEAAGLANLARQAKALENFLHQLCRSEPGCTDAALRTISRAVEVMSGISSETSGQGRSPSRFATVLVDEAPYSNRAMKEALLKAAFEPVCFEDPALAREYLAFNRADLIIANVVLPEAHGLALADIRQFPLHGETPVLFAPESARPLAEGLPTSGPRLDKEPLLLMELVVKALNEVQSTVILAPAFRLTASAGLGATRQGSAKRNVAASLLQEDGFELFAQAVRQEAPAVDSPAQGAVMPAQSSHQARSFRDLFTAADIPSEPILRAEPGTSGEDSEAELTARLPVTSIDGTQIADQTIEALPPAALQAERSQPPQPEPTVQDQTAEAAWLATVAGDAGQPVPARNTASGLEQNEVLAVQESVAAIPNYGKVMKNQLQAAPADYARQGEGSQPRQGVNQHNNQREDLAARVCTAEMALYHAQEQLEQRDKAIEALKLQLSQGRPGHSLAVNESALEGMSAQRARARCSELEQELAALRQAFEDFNGGFDQQQRASAEAVKQVQELEQRLSQNAADLEKQRAEQQRDQDELRRQLEAATAASQQTEAARQQAEARCAQLEQELGSLRQARVELANKSDRQQKVSEESDAKLNPSGSELEQQVRQGVAALARTSAELATERGQRQRSQQLAADLNGRLKALHEDLSRTLQVQGENLSRLSALEKEQRQTSQALERSVAEAHQQEAERRLAETQLQKAKEVNAQLRKDLSFFEDTNKKFDGSRQELQTRMEAILAGARENEARLQQESAERQRLTESLEEARRELQNQSRRRETVEQELQLAHNALQDREAKFQGEIAERQRLKEAQDSVQRNLRDGSERDLEFSKLQSALQLEQVERKRQETQLARTRHSALDAAHAARSLRTSLRRQIREPVDNLVHSAHSFLEQEMGEAQKKLAEAVLQDVLLVQTRLRDPDLAHSEPTEAPAPQPVTAT